MEKTFNTLFLDRDGVINKKLENDYVKTWEEFEFIDGVLECFDKLNSLFNRIIIVTNQKCIGKGIITENELEEIHKKMINKIEQNNGKIDKIYYSQALNDNDFFRKPQVGMFLKAKEDFKDIEFNKKSFMIGDSITDMIPGKALGLQTVFINETNFVENKNIDYVFPSLGNIEWSRFQ